MGGGHVSRPDFGMPQPDAAYPLTEFYLLAQQALEKSCRFFPDGPLRNMKKPTRATMAITPVSVRNANNMLLFCDFVSNILFTI